MWHAIAWPRYECVRCAMSRHQLNGYLAQRVPSLFLASSFRMCLSLYCLKLLQVCFPGGLGTHEARYPFSRCRMPFAGGHLAATVAWYSEAYFQHCRVLLMIYAVLYPFGCNALGGWAENILNPSLGLWAIMGTSRLDYLYGDLTTSWPTIILKQKRESQKIHWISPLWLYSFETCSRISWNYSWWACSQILIWTICVSRDTFHE